MRQWVLALLAAAMLQVADVRAADAQDAEAKYQAMLAAAKADPAATDWQALRFAYADQPSFSPYGEHGDRKALGAARAAGDWQALLAAANSVLDVNYVDGEAHLAAAIALSQLGKANEAERERTIAVAIFKSMMPNGDGRSPEQAFVVISVPEEYQLMAARRRRVVRQRLVHVAGHAYDALETTGPDGDTVTFYFLIDRVLARLARKLGER